MNCLNKMGQKWKKNKKILEIEEDELKVVLESIDLSGLNPEKRREV